MLLHPSRPWSVDASAMFVAPEDFENLPWERAFREMAELEAGAIANADEQRQVGHYWLRSPERAPTIGQARAIGDTNDAVRQFAAAIREGRETADDGLPFTEVLHIGIGGSALGPQMVIDALAEPSRERALRVHFLDNTDPDGIGRVLRNIGNRLRHTLAVVVSKSGGTTETRNAQLLFQNACKSTGLDDASRLIAITGEGSALHKQAITGKWRKIFPMWDWVGGRTSVTSAVGLLTAELAGVDTGALLTGARDMDDWTRDDRWNANPAALLAGCWYLAGGGRGDRAMVVLPYSDRLVLLSRHLQQLVMESIGKTLDRSGNSVFQGLTVFGNKGSTDQHAYVQQLRDGRNDFFVNFLQVYSDGLGSPMEVEPGVQTGDHLQAFLLGTRRALRESQRPSLTVSLPDASAESLGALIALYERAVGLYASLINVNAYHQPGVEAGKKASVAVLALWPQIAGRLPSTVDAIASGLNLDPAEVFHLLEHRVATGKVRRRGSLARATYEKVA